MTDYRDCDRLKKDSTEIGYCSPSTRDLEKMDETDFIPLNQSSCEASKMEWKQRSDSNFYCGAPQVSRDNHHGNNGPLGHSKVCRNSREGCVLPMVRIPRGQYKDLDYQGDAPLFIF